MRLCCRSRSQNHPPYPEYMYSASWYTTEVASSVRCNRLPFARCCVTATRPALGLQITAPVPVRLEDGRLLPKFLSYGEEIPEDISSITGFPYLSVGACCVQAKCSPPVRCIEAWVTENSPAFALASDQMSLSKGLLLVFVTVADQTSLFKGEPPRTKIRP